MFPTLWGNWSNTKKLYTGSQPCINSPTGGIPDTIKGNTQFLRCSKICVDTRYCHCLPTQQNCLRNPSSLYWNMNPSLSARKPVSLYAPQFLLTTLKQEKPWDWHGFFAYLFPPHFFISFCWKLKNWLFLSVPSLTAFFQNLLKPGFYHHYSIQPYSSWDDWHVQLWRLTIMFTPPLTGYINGVWCYHLLPSTWDMSSIIQYIICINILIFVCMCGGRTVYACVHAGHACVWVCTAMCAHWRQEEDFRCLTLSFSTLSPWDWVSHWTGSF